MISSGAAGRLHSTSNRSAGPNGGPTTGARLPLSAWSGVWMILVSSATQSVRSSLMFHSRPSRPPGASTRATSGTARAGSTQCQACATSTASTA